MTSTTRTARCGPACRVVWEGNGQAFSDRPLSRLLFKEVPKNNGTTGQEFDDKSSLRAGILSQPQTIENNSHR